MPRARNLYDPTSPDPYKLSRSKLWDFAQCPRCFYLDRRLGISRPGGPAFTLNLAVDTLLKREFDAFRENGRPHALMTQHSINATPYRHPDMEPWRNNFKGIQHHHVPTNLLITGAPDDIWQDVDSGDLIVVDYKATSTSREVTLDTKYREGFKRQLEIYQWLLRRNGFPVSPRAYVVYANAQTYSGRFDSRLRFEMSVLSHDGDDRWVEPCVIKAHGCLDADEIPPKAAGCAYCEYIDAVMNAN